MPIDTSIYNNGGTVADVAGGIAQGLKMRDMLRQQRLAAQEDQYNEALKQAYVMGPDGSLRLDQGKLPQLASMNGLRTSEMVQKDAHAQQALAQAKAQQQELDLKATKEKLGLAGQVANGVKDQVTHDAARAFLKSHGFTDEDIPGANYDPNEWARLQDKSLTYKDKLDQHIKDQERAQAEQRLRIEREGLDLRKGELAAKRDENAIKREEVRGEKIDKLAKDFKKDLDPDASRTGNFGQISARLQSGDRMKTLISSFQGGNLPPAQVEELALGMANMISGSSGAARSQVEALVPKSAMGDAQAFKSWLLNEPLGANQQKFVEMMGHTIDREMDLANKQLNEIRVKRLSAHDRLKKVAPDQYNKMLKDYGIALDSKGSPTETKEWQGVTYIKDGDHWVPQGK